MAALTAECGVVHLCWNTAVVKRFGASAAMCYISIWIYLAAAQPAIYIAVPTRL